MEGFFNRELEVKEVEVELNGVSAAKTLYELGWCVVEAGPPGKAKGFCAGGQRGEG